MDQEEAIDQLRKRNEALRNKLGESKEQIFKISHQMEVQQ